jgi:hypothetical protein
MPKWTKMTTTSPPSSTYSHTQAAPMCLFVYGGAIGMFVGAVMCRNEDLWLPIILAVTGVLMTVLAACFHRLTVTDLGDRLGISFGPVPLFHRSIRYVEIESVEVGRTLISEYWGIHGANQGGWVWNLWGRDCVDVQMTKGFLRIGTDDAENLAEFLTKRIGGR